MSTILIVDDRPINRQFLVTLLGYFGHEVLEAGDGGEALETLRCSPVDLVIADVIMPTIDGYEFLRRLRADPNSGRTPVIFYTAAGYDLEARGMAESQGVRHYLTKPAEPQAILAAVNSALGRNPAKDLPQSLRKLNRQILAAPADPISPNSVVHVVDNDREVRSSLSTLVIGAGLKIETFATAEEFLESYDPKRPGCLVVPLQLPGMSGIALLETLRSRRIEIPTIVLTAYGSTATAVDALRLRVLDFLEKPAKPRILLAVIRRALQDDSVKHRENAEVEAIRQRMATLTTREKELVNMLILGKSSKQIAAELRIAVKTVAHHRSHAMAKTGAENIADLVRLTMLSHAR